jgi:hypothetical protein
MLRDLLDGLLHHKADLSPVTKNPKKSELPSNGQLLQGMNKYKNSLPMDNLDGTFTGQPVGTTIFQEPGGWRPPLAIGQTMGSGLPHFDPLSSKERYNDSSYQVLPINPAIVPQPMPYMQYMKERM